MSSQPFGSTAPFAEPLWYSREVTQYYGESHRRLRAFIRKYVDEELRPWKLGREIAWVWYILRGEMMSAKEDEIFSFSCTMKMTIV